MNFKTHLTRIMANNRFMMRDSALAYRRARARGDLAAMVKHLLFATTFRNLNQGYQEAAR